MATIVCKQCPKTFRTETGFAWHHAHQHDLAQANDSVDPIPRLNSDDDPATFTSRIDDLEEIVGFMSDVASRITNVQTLLELAADSDETIAHLLAALKDQIEQLKLDVSSLFQLPQRLEAIEAKAIAQERAMAQLGENVLRLPHLLRASDSGQQRRSSSGTPGVRLVP